MTLWFGFPCTLSSIFSIISCQSFWLRILLATTRIVIGCAESLTSLTSFSSLAARSIWYASAIASLVAMTNHSFWSSSARDWNDFFSLHFGFQLCHFFHIHFSRFFLRFSMDFSLLFPCFLMMFDCIF